MLARIRKSQDSEAGFTLIELLVVIIIIGILAAIAIPTFLNQRKKGWLSAVKSDVANAIIAEESYATDNNGSYVTVAAAGTAGGPLKLQGFNPTQDVTVSTTGVGTPPTAFTISATHAKLSGCTVTYDSATGVTASSGC
jgi:type IV pilus assembly protein PilA